MRHQRNWLKFTRLTIPALSLAATTLLVAQGQPRTLSTRRRPLRAPAESRLCPHQYRRCLPPVTAAGRMPVPGTAVPAIAGARRFRLWPPRLLSHPHTRRRRLPFSRSPILPLGLVW